MHACMHGWMDGWMDGCMHAWMDGWHALMDGWIDGWMKTNEKIKPTSVKGLLLTRLSHRLITDLAKSMLSR